MLTDILIKQAKQTLAGDPPYVFAIGFCCALTCLAIELEDETAEEAINSALDAYKKRQTI